MDWGLLLLPLLLDQQGFSLELSEGQVTMVVCALATDAAASIPEGAPLVFSLLSINLWLIIKLASPQLPQPTEDCFCLKLFKKQIHQELF